MAHARWRGPAWSRPSSSSPWAPPFLRVLCYRDCYKTRRQTPGREGISRDGPRRKTWQILMFRDRLSSAGTILVIVGVIFEFAHCVPPNPAGGQAKQNPPRSQLVPERRVTLSALTLRL